MGPKEFRFCFATTCQQTLGRKELKDGTFQVFVSHFYRGCPMLGYETIYQLFVNLKVFNNLTIHWLGFASWISLNLCISKSIKPLSKPYNMPSS